MPFDWDAELDEEERRIWGDDDTFEVNGDPDRDAEEE